MTFMLLTVGNGMHDEHSLLLVEPAAADALLAIAATMTACCAWMSASTVVCKLACAMLEDSSICLTKKLAAIMMFISFCHLKCFIRLRCSYMSVTSSMSSISGSRRASIPITG